MIPTMSLAEMSAPPEFQIEIREPTYYVPPVEDDTDDKDRDDR